MWYLAWRYIGYHRRQTIVLVFAIASASFLPLATELLWKRLNHDLRQRAWSTPLLIGARGSETDLTLHALYFESRVSGTVPFGLIDELQADARVMAIPLAAGHSAARLPLVGSSLDYFDFRRLQLAEGRWMGRLGECVIGARAAKARGLEVGDAILTDNESFVNLLQYPLKLRIVGVLSPAGTPDDDAVFCDVKTVWVIEGLGHGHQDLREATEAGVVLGREEGEVIAGPAIKEYTEITAENEDSFHFHGNMNEFPLTAVIGVPQDERMLTILLGRWQDAQAPYRAIEPRVVMETLLSRVFRIKYVLDIASLLIAVLTAVLIALVVALSLKLRSAEMQTLLRIGCRRATTARLVGAELCLVGGMACLLLAAALTIVVVSGPELLRWWLVTFT